MESAGKRLKELRLKKGLSLEDVHRKTKIQLNLLKSIEEDNLVNLSPIYIKGFLKIYCQCLEVDPKDYIADYKEPQIANIVPQRKEKKESFSKKAAFTIAFLKPYFNRKTLKITGIVFGIGLAVFLVSKIKITLPKRDTQTKKVERVVAPVVKSQKKNPPVKVAAPKVPVTVPSGEQKVPVSATQPEPVKKEAPAGIRLGLHAKDDCWVQLKIDGKTVFQNILKKGRFEVWQAKERIDLFLGNVGNIELELNSKVIPSLGRKGQALKNIVITKDGLRVDR
ncbi:MAG: RodZ domain-containing protein [Candidatus Omnitrophota bacterium]|jgi:cytoskeletal protein RodZ